jgi:hypothetical protein
MIGEQVNLAVPSADRAASIDENARIEHPVVLVYLQDAAHDDVAALFTSDARKDLGCGPWNGFSGLEISAVGEQLWENDEVSIGFVD